VKLKDCLLGFIVGLVALSLGCLGGEISIRTYARFQKHVGRILVQFDPIGVGVVPYGQFGYRQRSNSIYHYSNGKFATSNAMGYRGPIVSMPKPLRTFRIVLLGESTTHGWGVGDDETIDAYMRSLLKDRYPTERFEVVNLAFDGYDSYQLVERLQSDGMVLEPDLIIVNSGINDVRNTRFKNLADPDPRTLIWEDVLRRLRVEQGRAGPTLWAQIKHHFYLARLPSIARQYWTNYQAKQQRGKLTPNAEAIDIFRTHLERIAALASQAHLPVIFSTPPSALPLSYAPEATSEISYWFVDAANTQRLRDDLAQQMRLLAVREINKRHKVAYVSYQLSPELFLDDCHLTPAGNRQMALNFVSFIENQFGDLLPVQRSSSFATLHAGR
jgi:lysophospholipase L1-like esterase